MPRKYKRIQISLPAIVTINPNKKDERILLSITVDISASGMMFYSEQSFFPNTPVKVVLLINQPHSLKNNIKVIFFGKVIRCQPGRFAVAFNKVHPISRKKEDEQSPEK
jgi:c-di-GMP-binding flagellar brake protein YcgR